MLSDIIQNAIFVNTDNVEELKEILPDPKDVVFYELDIINQSNEGND